MRRVDISIDTFAQLWVVRRTGEDNEEDIIRGLISERLSTPAIGNQTTTQTNMIEETDMPGPTSPEWVDILVWSLKSLGGRASLAEIYRKSKEGRRLRGLTITRNHEASARERLESYSSESKNYKHIADLFFMPEGKGAGIWALRDDLPLRYL